MASDDRYMQAHGDSCDHAAQDDVSAMQYKHGTVKFEEDEIETNWAQLC